MYIYIYIYTYSLYIIDTYIYIYIYTYYIYIYLCIYTHISIYPSDVYLGTFREAAVARSRQQHSHACLCAALVPTPISPLKTKNRVMNNSTREQKCEFVTHSNVKDKKPSHIHWNESQTRPEDKEPCHKLYMGMSHELA